MPITFRQRLISKRSWEQDRDRHNDLDRAAGLRRAAQSGPRICARQQPGRVTAADGDSFAIGGIQVCVLHVPGHEPTSPMSRAMRPSWRYAVMPDYGTARADFPGGMRPRFIRSIRPLSLPDETRPSCVMIIRPRGATSSAGRANAAGGREGAQYPCHAGIDEEELYRHAQGARRHFGHAAAHPASIQVNMRAGRLPEPESDGMRYLKLPVNAL